MRRFAFPFALGIVGIGILLSLGVWQLKRLVWKESLLAAIEARIGDEPVNLIAVGAADPTRQRYMPVTTTGQTTGQEILVLSGKRGQGAGYEVIAAFKTEDGRKILLDRGYIPEEARTKSRPPVSLTVLGNLDWPKEADSYTPAPDMASGLWFARDVPAMAKSLGTDAILVVIRKANGDSQDIVPVPVDTASIPNDHMQYAITWFSLAAVWAGMTAYLLWRIRQKTV